jgi:5,10-methylene-tetrahydrofolate dehydrogenase/methenyl tetrahydrofolate cyclohydrolase
VGERKDSQTYVRMKRRACAEVGIRSFDCDLPGDSTQQEVLEAVAKFNANPDVHGILVQLPVRRVKALQQSLASNRRPRIGPLPESPRQEGQMGGQ